MSTITLPVQASSVFLLWTVTSFLCHYFAKEALTLLSRHVDSEHDYTEYVVSALCVTIVQLGFCTLSIEMPDSNHKQQSRAVAVSHALATFATNLSMAATFASSTFAIKLMEPITTALMQFCVLGNSLSPMALLSLPLIVGGAIGFSGNPIGQSSLSFGVAAAFASNILLATRNIVLKGSGSRELQTRLKLKPRSMIFLFSIIFFLFALVFYSETQGYLPRTGTRVVVTTVMSSLFHVTYSYVSTGLVLSRLAVVTHAVANIMKRLLVVLLLHASGKRVASPSHLVSLAVCAGGLALYAWDKAKGNKVTVIRMEDKDSISAKSAVVNSANNTDCPRKRFSALLVILLSFVLLSSTVGLALTRVPQAMVKNSVDGLHSSQNAGFLASKPQFQSRTFSHVAHERPPVESLFPNLEGYLSPNRSEIRRFLDRNLFSTFPGDVNFLSQQLRSSSEVINEAQRLHFHVLGEAFRGFKFAMLLDIASFENKGDPCITIGEVYFLQRMNIEIVYYCNTFACTKANLQTARNVADKYKREEMAIMIHGGGNVVGYAMNDIIHFNILQLFKGFKIFMFPQSIWVRNFGHPHLKRCAENYCCNPDFTLVLRDRLSFDIARRYFNGSTRLLMAPDMAFQIGPVPRFLSPVFDIMWIRRKDKETPGYTKLPPVPQGLRVHVSDWWAWQTPAAGNNMEKAFYIASNGFFFLQRGRVVITDRLHGHILATLMDIPHVLIDNKAKKLSSYHWTWTRGVANTLITDRPERAVELAVSLLDKFSHELPPRVPAMNISEGFVANKEAQPDTRYP